VLESTKFAESDIVGKVVFNEATGRVSTDTCGHVPKTKEIIGPSFPKETNHNSCQNSCQAESTATNFYDHLPIVHCEKSICSLHCGQVCGRSNSSEKISFSLPHFGHLQIKDERFLLASNPGQCIGVLIAELLLFNNCKLMKNYSASCSR